LKKIFIQENVFCTDVIPVSNETSFDITATVVADNVSTTIPPTTLPDESLDSCSSQETDLTNAYTYACVVFALVGVPVGAIFDKFGTTTTRMIGALLFLCGNISVLSAKNNHSLLYPALCLVACSGLFFLTCQQQTGNLFVEARGKVISMINGAMDSSSSFALALYTIYSYAGYKTTFMVFGGLSILIIIRTLMFYTKTSIPYPLPQNYQIDPPIGSCLAKNNSPSDRIIEEEKTALENQETSSESIEEETNEKVPEFFSKDVFLSPLYASTGNALTKFSRRHERLFIDRKLRAPKSVIFRYSSLSCLHFLSDHVQFYRRNYHQTESYRRRYARRKLSNQ